MDLGHLTHIDHAIFALIDKLDISNDIPEERLVQAVNNVLENHKDKTSQHAEVSQDITECIYELIDQEIDVTRHSSSIFQDNHEIENIFHVDGETEFITSGIERMLRSDIPYEKMDAYQLAQSIKKELEDYHLESWTQQGIISEIVTEFLNS
jgi:hypothetical protein